MTIKFIKLIDSFFDAPVVARRANIQYFFFENFTITRKFGNYKNISLDDIESCETTFSENEGDVFHITDSIHRKDAVMKAIYNMAEAGEFTNSSLPPFAIISFMWTGNNTTRIEEFLITYDEDLKFKLLLAGIN